MGGHTVNMGVVNGGAQLHRYQNIGWARFRVPTVQIRPCSVSEGFFLPFPSHSGNRVMKFDFDPRVHIFLKNALSTLTEENST